MPHMMRARWVPTIVILALFAAAPLLSGRLVPPIVGFGLFAFAGVAGIVLGAGFVGGGAYGALRGRPWARRTLVTGAGPLAIGIVFLGMALTTPGGATFNDITTDLADPPIFTAGPAAGLAYPDAWRTRHREVYPDLAPARLNAPADTAFSRAKALIEANGWTIAAEDRGKGVIQALARTSIFLFEDDVIVRVRGGATESVVDLRSRSRVGRGDRGVNAARIRVFLKALAP